MKRLCAVTALFVLLYAGSCPTRQRTIVPTPVASAPLFCPVTLTAEVEGVSVLRGGEVLWRSTASGQQQLDLLCSGEELVLTKDCLPSLELMVQPQEQGMIRISSERWEKYGYLRVENTSSAIDMEVRNLPGGVLSVPAKQHVVHRLPLGEYEVTIAAPYKNGVARSFRLCAEDEIFSLRVSSLDAEGDLMAQGEQTVALQHGRGRLRVVTLASNTDFRIAPERTAGLRAYLDTQRMADVLAIDPKSVPKGLQQLTALIQKLEAKRFKAPSCLSLPSGRYHLSHSLQQPGTEGMTVDVLPDMETRLELPESVLQHRPIPADQLTSEDLCGS